jgi:hypothetical protein
MRTCPAWRSVLHDDLSCMTTCPVWRPVQYDDLSCMRICNAWRRHVMHDDMSWMAACPAWRPVLHDDLSCMTTCPAWLPVLHDDLSCLTTCPVLLFGSHFCWCLTHRRESRQINFLAAFYHDGKISPAWRGWGEGCTPSPFTLSTIMSKVVVLQLRGHAIHFFHCDTTHAKRTVLVLYVRTYLTHYHSTDMGKIISDKLFIWDFLAVKLNFNLFDFYYILPAVNTTLQSYWKVHIKDLVGAAT